MDGFNLLGALAAPRATSLVQPVTKPAVKPTVKPPKKPISIPKAAIAAKMAQRHLDAGKRALAVAQSMSKGVLAPHGAKLAKKANALMVKAQRELTAASHTSMGLAPPGDDGGAVDINILRAVTQIANSATMVNAVLSALSSGGTIKAAADAEAKIANTQSVMGGYDDLLGYGASDVVNDGNALLQRATDVIDNYDPSTPDQSIPATVAAINKDIATWNQEINQLVATSPTATLKGPDSTTPPAGAPTIASVLDSTNGQTSGAPGDTVIITGTNFTGTTGVTFGGSPAVPFQVISPTQMTALIPQNATTGVVQVTTPAGTGSSQPFTINPAQAPPSGGGGGGYGGGGGGGGFDGGGGGGGGGGSLDDDGGGADDGVMTDPSADPNNVMYDPYADEGGSFDNDAPADDGSTDDGSYTDDGSDGGGDDGAGDDALVGHSGGGHGNGHHNGHHGGRRGFWGGPWEDVDGLEVIDAVDVDDTDREEVVNDIVDKLVKRMQDKTLIGEYNITTAQRQMNTIKQATVAIARAMVKGGEQVAAATIALAEGGLFQKELPGITSLKNTQGHLQWHAEALSKLSDPTALYESSDDVKKWTMQAFIDANAVEEGRAQQEKIWQSMWTEIGAALAALPKEIVQTIVTAPGKIFESLTGIPAWAFWVGGAIVVVFLGIGVWKLLKIATPIATRVAVSRYLP